MSEVALIAGFALIPLLLGTLATYLYEDDAPLAWRVAAGACTALAGLGLLGFLLAFAFSLAVALLLVALTALVSTAALVGLSAVRRSLVHDVRDALGRLRGAVAHPTRVSSSYALIITAAVALSWIVLRRVLIVGDDGWHTGVMNNFGDLPFHLGVIARFATGTNVPPENPIFAGVPFTYPFLADFITALPVAAGASVRSVMLVQNLVLLLAFGVLMYHWALQLTKDRLAALIACTIVFASGGLGWWLLFSDAQASGGIVEALRHLNHDYTIRNRTTWRWANVVTALLIPQRSILLGLPIALVIFRLFYREVDATDQVRPLGWRRLVAGGVLAGLLPLVHAHSLMVVCGAAVGLATLFGWSRKWLLFFAVLAAVATPQIGFSAIGSATNASSMIGWQIGWDRGTDNLIWFWLKNTGLLIPLVVAAFIWRQSREHITRTAALFYVPFVLCFLVANVIRLAPWIWDNIKVLVYWLVASAPFAAIVLAQLWRGGPLSRLAAVVMLASLTLAGSLDLWRIASGASDARLFDSDGLAFAERIRLDLPPHALILHAPVQNHPVFLSGRRSFMGFPGHVWSHGLSSAGREQTIKEIYAGAANADDLLARNGIDYVVVGPLERRMLHPNLEFFARFPKTEGTGEFDLYRITARTH
jgi:hypothetical protein